MQCYLCGKDIGDNLGTCKECREEADQRRSAEYEALTEGSTVAEKDKEEEEEAKAEQAAKEQAAKEEEEEEVDPGPSQAIIALKFVLPVVFILLFVALGYYTFGQGGADLVEKEVRKKVFQVRDYAQYQDYYDSLFQKAYKRAKAENLVSPIPGINRADAARTILRDMIAQAKDDERYGIASELEAVTVN